MSNVEEAKRIAAKKAVADYYPSNPKFVGIGSGSTIVYVVEAIKDSGVDTSNTLYIPTGYQSRQLIVNAGLTPIAFDSLPEGVQLDVAFDGADEVDESLNCIKGGGACLFQEKLVAMQAKQFVCVAGKRDSVHVNRRGNSCGTDHRKLQKRLLTGWPSIPIEVCPIAARRVLTQLKELGSKEPKIREGQQLKEGPVKTDQDFFIIDAPFPGLLTKEDVERGSESGKDGAWEVEELANKIKSIQGVLEVGLFYGKTGPEAIATKDVGGQRPVAAYFGMQDGSVVVRKA